MCNHPELFERRDTKSPFVMKSVPYLIPKMIYHNYFHRHNTPFLSKLAFHHPKHIHEEESQQQHREYLEVPDDPYAFLRIADISPADFNAAFTSFEYRIEHWSQTRSTAKKNRFHEAWQRSPKNLVFLERQVPIRIASQTEPVYGTNDIKIKCMKETLSHRVIRSKKNESALAKIHPHVKRPDIIRSGI